MIALFLALSAFGSVEQISHDIKNERQQIVQAEVQKRSIMAVLYEINKNLNKINYDIQSMEDQLSQSKRKIETQSQLLARLENTKEIQREQLWQRLRALYKIGYHGYAEVLLSSHSSAELARNVKFLKIITKKDLSLIQNYKNSITRIAAESVYLKKQIRNYLITEKRLNRDKIKYDEQKQIQVSLLSEVETNKQIHLRAYKELKNAALKFEEQLRTMNLSDSLNSAFFEFQGKLQPPVRSRIGQKFGIMTDDKFSTKIFHKGLFFESKTGESVLSVFDGKVAFTGWVDGFGDTIIVDHGDHYYSIYAHNSKIQKAVGDAVKRGEVIAKSGDSGSLRGEGLYFEIRHFSESLDPLNWLTWRRHVSQAAP
ncbi:MAG: peptidoglycan DD-metalloendopeptidase family protein [Oligoflexia bacterium]|nr:peptidoglycan DD-metalloendopeptidase family protein [Oligoflexia bacterium]